MLILMDSMLYSMEMKNDLIYRTDLSCRFAILKKIDDFSFNYHFYTIYSNNDGKCNCMWIYSKPVKLDNPYLNRITPWVYGCTALISADSVLEFLGVAFLSD
jgi:hypothetical protein